MMKESEVDRWASIAGITGRQIDGLTAVLLIGIVILDRSGGDEPPSPTG